MKMVYRSLILKTININFDDYDKKSDASTQNYRGWKKTNLISFLSKPEIINRIEILKKLTIIICYNIINTLLSN